MIKKKLSTAGDVPPRRMRSTRTKAMTEERNGKKLTMGVERFTAIFAAVEKLSSNCRLLVWQLSRITIDMRNRRQNK